MSLKSIIEIPKNINHFKNPDYVTYKVTENKISKELENQPCYSSHMSKLPTTEFFLTPNEGKIYLPSEIYLEFVNICKANKIVPKEVQAEAGKNIMTMHIPANNYSKHRVYASLCVYRWADCVPPFAYTVVKMQEKYSHLTFWQILQYVMGLYIDNSGHSFNYICKVGNSYTCDDSRKNIGLGLAMGLFFQKPCKVLIEEFNHHNTQSAIHKLLDQISGSSGIYKPSVFTINKAEEILEDKWIPFFELIYNNQAIKLEKLKEKVSTVYNGIKNAKNNILE